MFKATPRYTPQKKKNHNPIIIMNMFSLLYNPKKKPKFLKYIQVF